MPQHAVGRGAQAKLLRGSKRAFFACVGEAGSAGSNLSEIDRFSEPLPPSVGALVFLGLPVFWLSPLKNSADTVPQKLPALKCFRMNRISGSPHRSGGMIPTYSLRQPRSPCSPIPAPLALFSGWVARGSAPPLAAACGRGLTSAALVGAAIGRSAPGKDPFQSHQGNITRKKYVYLSYFPYNQLREWPRSCGISLPAA